MYTHILIYSKAQENLTISGRVEPQLTRSFLPQVIFKMEAKYLLVLYHVYRLVICNYRHELPCAGLKWVPQLIEQETHTYKLNI